MSIIFFDPKDSRTKLLPLTYTRPIAEIRIGIFNISEKWCLRLKTEHFGYETETYLKDLFPGIKADIQNTWINSTILPNDDLVAAVKSLGTHEALLKDGILLAFKGENKDAIINKRIYEGSFSSLNYPWDIFQLNGQEITEDYKLVKSRRKGVQINDPYTRTYGSDIFIEEGADIKAAILNAERGPIYIGKNAEVQEGAIIRGPFSLGEHSIISMGSKMRGDTTVGPHSKVGGEVSNSVIFGYTNKGHDGYLGNAVLGEWCNLGAATNNSNLKNTYNPVKMWDYDTLQFEQTDLQFCGLIMGDHTKVGINTMFNTGTSVGVSANIFGSGFPRQLIPSFAWGGNRGFITYSFEKALKMIGVSMRRKNKEMTPQVIKMLEHVFKDSSIVRNWEKQNK